MTLPLSTSKAAVMVAQVLSAPAAAVLMSLHGLGGVAGWQLLCLVEGGATVLVGLSLMCFLPPRPASVKALSARELEWIHDNVSPCAFNVCMWFSLPLRLCSGHGCMPPPPPPEPYCWHGV
jgi:hypothetical protein